MTETLFPTFGVSHDPSQAVRTLAESIAGMLRFARIVAESGRPVELAGLDGQIGLLCAKTLDLPPEQGRALGPVLAGLLDQLEALQRSLKPPGM